MAQAPSSNTPPPPQVQRASGGNLIPLPKKTSSSSTSSSSLEAASEGTFSTNHRFSRPSGGGAGAAAMAMADDMSDVDDDASTVTGGGALGGGSPSTPNSRRSFSLGSGSRRSSMEELAVEANPSPTVQHAILEKPKLKRWDSGDFFSSPAAQRKQLATQAKDGPWGTTPLVEKRRSSLGLPPTFQS